MPLHPQAQAFLTGVEAMGLPPFGTLSLEEGRATIAGLGGFMDPPEEVASVIDTIAVGPDADVPIRIFIPAGQDEPPPVIMYFHGGGFTTGSVDIVDPLCRALANRSGCAVAAVGYRLAPEHPYPAAVTDAYIATSWMAAKGLAYGVDGTRLAVMGDSAGGNLATVTSMIGRDKADEFPIALQVLIYPVVVCGEADFPSRQENGEGYLLDNGMMNWFISRYLTGVEDKAAEPYCSPLVAQLNDLPPAIIVVAEYDPLRDEGIEYAKRLKEDGVFVDLRQEAGMIHGFFWTPAVIDRGRELVDELGAEIGKILRDQ
ncbi:MAG TPA: alpha/beta hydrolase [Acidimicrobiia bacterium]|jgi:acetyl esterase